MTRNTRFFSVPVRAGASVLWKRGGKLPVAPLSVRFS